MEQQEINFEYDAFISYRHTPRDTQIAEKLHKALETYRTPSYLVKKGFQPKLKKVFRDREELPTSSDLGQDIENALMRSRYLIIICSPEAVQSKWVLREVEMFGEFHSYDKILTLLVDGEPSESFPPKLIRYLYDDQGALSKVIEPLAADIRSKSDESPIKLLKTEKLRLIASILDCRYDELRQRDLERRVRRIVAISASSAAFLMVVTAFTLWQLNEVNMARELAVKNEQQALSNQSSLYAMLANGAADNGDRLLGMSMAMEALPKNLQNPEKPLTQEAKDALYYSAVQYGIQERTYLYPSTDSANEIAQSCFFNRSNGDIITMGGRAVRQFSPATGRQSLEWMAPEQYEILAVSPNADRAVIARYRSGEGLDMQLWDLPQNRLVAKQEFDPGDNGRTIELNFNLYGIEGLLKAGFGHDGNSFFIAANEFNSAGGKSEICLYDSASGKPLDFFRLHLDDLTTDVILNGDRLAAVKKKGDKKEILIYEIQGNLLKHRVDTDNSTHIDGRERSFGLTTAGKKLSYFTEDFILHVVDLETGKSEEVATRECEISSDGNFAAFFNTDEHQIRQFVVYDIVQNKTVVLLKGTQTLQLPGSSTTIDYVGFTFCSNNYILFNDAELLDINKAELNLLPINDMVHADSDPNGKYLAYLDQYGTGVVIQMRDPHVYEVLAQAAEKAVVGDTGVILFDNQLSGGTIVQRWDAELKTFSNTDYEESNLAGLCDITGGAVGFMGSQSNIDVFSLDTGRKLSALKTEGQFNDFQTDPSGKYILVSKYSFNSTGTFLFDAQTGRQIHQFSASDISGSMYSTMRCVGFFPDGKHCWSAEYNEPENEYTGIVIYDLETKEPVSCIPVSEDFGDFSAQLSPDGSRMLVIPLHTLQLWSIDQQMNPACMSNLQGSLLCMNDSVIVTNEKEYTANMLYIYDTKTGQQKAMIRLPDIHGGYKGILISGGKYLLTITATSAEVGVPAPASKFGPIQMTLWECSTGKAVAQIYNDCSMGTDILDIGLINGGKEITIVSRNNDKTCIRTIPFADSFEQVYNLAQDKLAGRVFDLNQDMDHIQ